MNLRCFKTIACCLALLLVGSAAYSDVARDDSDAVALFSKMQRAALHESYRGTFMFSRGNMSSTMRVVHRYHNDQEQERLTQLDGEMGEILRRGSEVMCLINGQRLVQVDKDQLVNPASNAFDGYMPGHKHYNLSKVGYERIVDRSSIKLAINAKDDVRYSYQLWIDEQSGLLLKSHVLDLEGRALESFQFTHLELPSTTTDSEFEFETSENSVAHHRIPMSRADKRWPERLMWEAAYIPAGFMSVESSGAHHNVMLYSDGLASYSVFVEKLKTAALPEGASIVGATVVYLSKLDYENKQYSVTVVGEIPAMTAMKVAKNVRAVMQ